jgi:hypothetical protein
LSTLLLWRVALISLFLAVARNSFARDGMFFILDGRVVMVSAAGLRPAYAGHTPGMLCSVARECPRDRPRPLRKILRQNIAGPLDKLYPIMRTIRHGR